MDPVTIDGITFPPVYEQAASDGSRHRQYRQAEINGKPVYAVPGGLMAFRDQLPDIARQIARCIPPVKR